MSMAKDTHRGNEGCTSRNSCGGGRAGNNNDLALLQGRLSLAATLHVFHLKSMKNRTVTPPPKLTKEKSSSLTDPASLACRLDVELVEFPA